MWVGVTRSGRLCLSKMRAFEGYFQTAYQSEINCSAKVHQTRLHLPAVVMTQSTAQGLFAARNVRPMKLIARTVKGTLR